MIRPAVSSLKDRKSIRPHYSGASMSISPADTLQWLSHMHTPPANTKRRTLKWSRAAQYDIVYDSLYIEYAGSGIWICHLNTVVLNFLFVLHTFLLKSFQLIAIGFKISKFSIILLFTRMDLIL